MTWLTVWFIPLVLCWVCSAQLTVTPTGPVFINENQADILLFNGTYIWQEVGCTIKDVEGQSSVPDVKISVNHVTTSGTCTFNVTLLSPVDYEKTTSFTVNVILRKDCFGIETQQTLNKAVFVKNLLDTPPAFTNSTYSVSIPENHVVNTSVIVNIRAIDADRIDRVSYHVNFVDPQQSMFRVQLQSNPEILDIYLISSVDFEQQHIHHFTITATDTVGMNSTCEVVIKIINIQDTPPAFTALQYNGRINEEDISGTVVLTVSATDGDSVFMQDQWEGTTANQIYYSILNGDVGMFGINSSTGQIVTVRELDIDNNSNVTNGLVVLKIMAEELNTSMEPQYAASSATVLVLVQIEDANDNRPQFSSQSFTGSIRADAALGEFITIESGGYISVYDIDQAPSNNRFCLHIEKDGQPWDVFKPNIEAQYAYASVMIQLNKNNSITDFGDTHIKFQIVAQECGNLLLNFAPTKSEMTVWVKPRTVPPTTPEPIINLPLSTSDIIVFVVGLLLLLNFGLSIFICYALRRGRGHSMSVLNRNSKYKVSNRKMPGKENDDNLSNTNTYNEGPGNIDTSKRVAGQGHMSRTELPATSREAQPEICTSVAAVSTVALAVNRSHSDITLLEEKDTTLALNMNKEQARNTEVPKQSSADIRASQMRSQETLMNILNENNAHNYEVIPLKTSSSKNDKSKITDSAESQEDQIVSEFSNLGQGLSSFLLKVQQKLGHGNKYDKGDTNDLHHEKLVSLESSLTETTHIDSNNSSFSEKTSGDAAPLIKSSCAEFQSNSLNHQAHENPTSSLVDLPVTSEKAKESGKEKDKKQNVTFLSDSSSPEDKKSVLSKTKDKMIPSSPPDHRRNKDVNTYPTTSQLTQTGVPPVALALPYSTGTFNINKESPIGIINPVFETSAATSPVSTETSFASTTAVIGKTGHSQSVSMSSATQNLTSLTMPSGMPDYPKVAGLIEEKSGSSPPPSEGSSSYAFGSLSEQFIVPLQGSIIEETTQLPNSPIPSTQTTSSSQSLLVTPDSQDYAAAAKNLLTTAIKDTRIKQTPLPKTVTIFENAAQLKKQNMKGEKFTSF